MSRGRFIVLDGPDGTGKSTQARMLTDWLRARGRRVVLTREPGGSPLAERIRDVLLSGAERMPAHSELLLMFAARHAHLEQTVLPALAAGSDVVCDRYVDASYAYQGAGRGVDLALIDTLCASLPPGAEPDLVLLLDLPDDLAVRRIAERGGEDRFERETPDFRERVRAAFRQRAQVDRRRLIDASGDPQQVLARILAEVEQLA